MENPNQVYGLNPTQYEVNYEQYMNFEKSFGEFSEDYETYTVTDRNTPRQWFNFLVNKVNPNNAVNDKSAPRIDPIIKFFIRDHDLVVVSVVAFIISFVMYVF